MAAQTNLRPTPQKQEVETAIADVMDRFAAIQLSCYIASCIAMVLYAFHFASGFPITIRINMHNACETVLLVFRGLNEVVHGKLDRNHIMHHSVYIVGSWVILNVPECISFSFLLSHMQCLHFPMVLWYAGGRRSLARPGRSFYRQLCAATFPSLWVFCVAYRTVIMSFSLYSTLRHLPILISIPFFVMLRVTTSTDHSCTSHFFKQLGRPSKPALTLAIISGAALGILALFLPAA